MATATKEKKSDAVILKRVNTRILPSQDAYIKAEVKRSKGELTEGDVHRALLSEAISNRGNNN